MAIGPLVIRKVVDVLLKEVVDPSKIDWGQSWRSVDQFSSRAVKQIFHCPRNRHRRRSEFGCRHGKIVGCERAVKHSDKEMALTSLRGTKLISLKYCHGNSVARRAK